MNSADATYYAPGSGSLVGRVALVTGAGGRIGAQIARVLAREGAAIVVADRDASSGLPVAEAITSSGCASFFIAVDMADAQSVRAMVDEAHGRLGQVDILVNNAAATHLTRTDGTLVGLNRQVWDEAIAVNLTGPMLAAQRTIEYMIQRGTGGSLVHVSSAAGLRGDDQLTAYSVSKGGIFALSRQIAVQCGRFGIRSNVVAPGVTVASDSGVAAEKPIAYEAMLATSMLGRLGSPADQANAVLFLASDQSAFITGTVLTVDGGLTSVQAWVPLRRLAAAELARLPRHGARARATLVLGSDSVRSYCR